MNCAFGFMRALYALRDAGTYLLRWSERRSNVAAAAQACITLAIAVLTIVNRSNYFRTEQIAFLV